MASLDAAAMQLADSLQVHEVPAKLRCGSCNKLAANAVKLPCCDQSICELCSLDLPETCPICSHSPLSSEDCKPNKSLRMTVKAFIKSEEKKRSKDVGAPSAPPLQPAIPTVVPNPMLGPAAGEVEAGALVEPSNGTNNHGEEAAGSHVTGQDLPTADAEVQQVNGAVSTDPAAHVDADQEDDEDDEDDVVITTEPPEPAKQAQQQQQHGGDKTPVERSVNREQENSQMTEQQDFGFGQNQHGFGQNQQGFANMDFTNMNSFNPMMAMQGGMGMPNFGMGMPNMTGKHRTNDFIRRSRLRGGLKGMPGMHMDPSMMFNGGFGGMGGINDMSMMNMGMGMGNMGGFGSMPGMGMNGGDPGFFPGNGGYNQPQSFGNNMHQQNFHHNRGYGGRPYNRGYGRGRGWGGYNNRGRGGWQNYGQYQGQNQNAMNQPYHQQQNFQGNDENFDAGTQQGARRGSPSYEPMKGAGGSTSDTSTRPRQTDAEPDTDKPDAETTDLTGDEPSGVVASVEGSIVQPLDSQKAEDVAKNVTSARADSESVNADTATEGAAEPAMSISPIHNEQGPFLDAYTDQNNYDQQYQQGYSYGGRGRGGFRGGRGGFRGRGGAYGYVATPGEPAPAPPVNAPTGPKALRQGLPNSGWYSRPQPPAAPATSPTVDQDRSRQADLEERGRSRSRSYSRSEHKDRKEKHRSRDEDYTSEEERRKHERRKRRERDRKDDDVKDGRPNGDESSRADRSRSESPVDEHSRRRHRDKDEDRHGSRSYRDRSRDKHRRRHRSRSVKRDGHVNGDSSESSRRKSKTDRRKTAENEESDRVKDHERSRRSSRREDDYEHQSKERPSHSSKHVRSTRDDRGRDRDQEREREREKHRPVLEEPQDDIGFKIKGTKSASMQAGVDTTMAPPASFSRGRDSRRQSTQDSIPPTPSTPTLDPYAEEREKRQRERLDRENTLRRQSTQSLGKRTSRDEDDFEAPSGPRTDKGRAGKKARRKMEYKYEDEIGDGYDERETKRWR